MNQTQVAPAKIRHYRRLVRSIVSRHFGKPASRIVYKRTGLTNYVFAVNHLEGQFVIRISPDPEKINSFKKEQWATQKVREAGVPTQEVLAVGIETTSEPYMIARRVTGVEATHHPRRTSIVHELGRFAAIINSIQTNNFGNFFDWIDTPPKRLSWADYLDEEWGAEHRLSVLASHRILPESSITKLRRIIDDVRTIKTESSLNHGDLRMKNVIVEEEGSICAIIDWDDCLSTIAPAWELSIALHDLTIDEKQSFVEGYGCTSNEMSQMVLVMRTLNILNYSGPIESAVEKQDFKALSEFKLRLNGSLDLYCLE
jgi:aminoglycoside phosphotransferase (APT) family kinase protein